MTITISLPPETEQKLRDRARVNGQDVVAFVHELITKAIEPAPTHDGNGGPARPEATAPQVTPHGGMTFDEILAPIRREFEESGLTEEEQDELLRASIREVREARRKAQP